MSWHKSLSHACCIFWLSVMSDKLNYDNFNSVESSCLLQRLESVFEDRRYGYLHSWHFANRLPYNKDQVKNTLKDCLRCLCEQVGRWQVLLVIIITSQKNMVYSLFFFSNMHLPKHNLKLPVSPLHVSVHVSFRSVRNRIPWIQTVVLTWNW